MSTVRLQKLWEIIEFLLSPLEYLKLGLDVKYPIRSGVDALGFNLLFYRTDIGRDEGVQIQIIDSHVLRKHMQISFNAKDETYSVVDMSSKHGVFVNGMPIKDEAILNDNDQITVGKTVLMFTLEDFRDRENALMHYKKVGQRNLPTILPDPTEQFGA